MEDKADRVKKEGKRQYNKGKEFVDKKVK